ncbi:nagb/rpia/CoA transferase-like protein [Daldinia caldariorum]|uniref:nagb/rpia/CoA transferase-like protein n=1 Tax=Daldinia caldariorum TaxID=326644 RepID=UPI0020086306|nr:nagb/rpia/CoA transferase-like protein [Daldinia caldariorum]KAI1473272.1 nagb/rpia/CoA transferase-like protein [Daldinia caldariorum]
MASRDATNGNTGLKKRSIAGSFLFKLPHGDGKQAQVALFKRSGKVSTYQHKYAPISGSVEKYDASPLATALREINEETGLTLSSLELLRVGKPYSFVDESIGREWTINPFGFRLKDKSEGGKGEEGITIDWEHEGFEWFNPLDVSESDEFGGVPKLVTSLRRVWPEYDLGPRAGKVLTSGLQQLREDHESGARQLADLAISILKNTIEEMDSDVVDDKWWANIRMAAWHICKARESMGAAITSATVKALDLVEKILAQDLSPPEKIRNIADAIEEQLGRRKSTTDRIRDAFVDYLRQNVVQTMPLKETLSILTLSSSSTISACLLEAAVHLGVSVDLRILESRPLYEGVTLASKLLEAKPESVDLKVTIYTDASAALAADGIDIFVLGADRISSTGDVSNKIGSLPALLCQRHVVPNAKTVILSETEKVAGPGMIEDHPVEENSPTEVIRAWKGNVKGVEIIERFMSDDESGIAKGSNARVRNSYFEWVPANFIHAYITDEGVWSIKNITERSDWVGNEMDRFFKDL